MFRDLETANTGLDGLAAHVAFGANLAHDGATTSGAGALVSGSYFPVLGIRPALGRLLGPADDERVGEHYVTVLSYSYWENQLGLDRSVLNTTLIVNGQPMTIVGVAAPGFAGTTLGGAPDIFVPITMRGTMMPQWEGFERRNSYWAYLFGRMRPGATIEQSSEQINTVYGAIINEVEAPLQSGMSDQTMERFLSKQIVVEEGHRGQISLNAEAQTPLTLLFSITGFVLLIACTNIANLLLACGASRAREMAIRGSLGASRRLLLGQLLTESVLLAVLGGIASRVGARWTLSAISATLPAKEAATLLLELSPTMVVFTGLVSLGTGLLFGMYPALHSSCQDLVAMLKAGGGQPSAARAATRFRQTLVTGQIALSMALLMAAGLFIESLNNVASVDLGLNIESLVSFDVAPAVAGALRSRRRGTRGDSRRYRCQRGDGSSAHWQQLGD
jgi:predicted permease